MLRAASGRLRCTASQRPRGKVSHQDRRLIQTLRPSHPCSRKRFYSTPAPPTPPSPDAAAPVSSAAPRDLRSQLSSSQQPPKAPRRRFSTVVIASLSLMFGLAAGQYLRYVLAPPAPPLPGSEEDAALMRSLHLMAAKLPLVRSLSEDPAWRSWHAYSHVPEADRKHRFTTGPLGGTRGLGGYQRIFEHVDTGEFVSVVWIGGAVAGWPGVAHGGLVATLLDESLGRCAFARLSAGTGVTVNLQLKYLSPTVTNAFHVVRCTPMLEGSSERKQWVSARLERLDGTVCVESKALFVVPKKSIGKLMNMRHLGEEF
ncbi:MAG: hypothetical protein M1818_002032 [Claussenomyces sp. TS43310]|nr:MAG: hypothetical protein M1818_002032 [Claussenomyces sp. TS43310]